jgi:hypothetical protein
MIIRVYLTHCSASKNDSIRGTVRKVNPQTLYTALPLQRFIAKCIEKKVEWAIFSDIYGVWFPDQLHEWYKKTPIMLQKKNFSNY